MRALEGIKVLDLTRALAGPFCTLMLGDYGADVIKIEIPGTGDDTRHWGPPFIGDESAYFLSINRNKKSMTLNFKEDEARKIFLKLAAESDVIVENFTPGVMERFGLSYDEVKKVNNKKVNKIKDMQDIIGKSKPGDLVSFQIQRKSDILNINVEVEKMPKL